MGRLCATRIAVIGGGPAGAIAASRLRLLGAAVTLFHREPRGGLGKPCGGGVLPAAFPRSESIGRPLCRAIDVRSLTVVSPRGRSARIECESLFRVFRRSELDAALRREAAASGVDVVEAPVTDFSVSESGVSVACGGTVSRHEKLVAADGVRSLVRAKLGVPFPDEDLMRAVGYEITGPEPEPPASALVAFEKGLRGYLWVFPRPGGASVGACGDAAATAPGELRSRLDAFLDSAAARTCLGGGGERLLTSWFIPALTLDALERNAVEAGPVAFVGDAAGTADPITAEGIRPAIESAEALSRAWGSGAPYRAEFARSLLPPLRAAASLKRLFYATPVLEAIVLLADRSATLRAQLVDLVRGEAGADGAGSRLRRNLPRILAEAAFDRRAGAASGGSCRLDDSR